MTIFAPLIYSKKKSMTEKKEARIITLAHQKGGVGKTVICSIIASELHDRGYKIALIDTDDQGSLFILRQMQLKENPQLLEKVRDFPVLHYPDLQKISSFINDEINNYDYIIIDSPGKIDNSVKNIINNSDFVITPLTSGDTDWASLQTFLKVVKDVIEDNQNVKIITLYNRVQKTNRWDEFMHAVPDYLNKMDVILPAMDSFLFGKKQPLQLGLRDEYQTLDTINPITKRSGINWKVRDEASNFINAIIKQLI